MHEPWWRRLDIVQAAAVMMTLKSLAAYSSLIVLSPFADNILLISALFLFIIYFCIQPLHVKTVVICLFFCVVAAVTCIIIDDFSILITVLTISVLCHYDVKQFVKVVFWTSLCFCLAHIAYTLFYSLCFSPATFTLVSGGRIRFAFGFVHPNAFSSLTASISMMYLWLYGTRHFWRKFLLLLGVQFLVFQFSDSRTAFLASVLSLFLSALARNPKAKKLVRFALCVAIPGLAAFMLVMMHLYASGNGLAIKINSLLNNRILLGAYAYDHLGLSLIGQYVPFHKSMQWDPAWKLTSFTFDNAYSYLLVQGGLFWVAALSLIFILVNRKISTRNGVFLLIWAIYGMCENTVLNGYMMFPIFLIADVFSRTRRSPNIQKE